MSKSAINKNSVHDNKRLLYKATFVSSAGAPCSVLDDVDVDSDSTSSSETTSSRTGRGGTGEDEKLTVHGAASGKYD